MAFYRLNNERVQSVFVSTHVRGRSEGILRYSYA